MIKQEVKKTVFTATDKYAAINDVDPSNIQVYITDKLPESPNLTYQIAIGWQPGDTVKFLELRDRKFEFVPIEDLITPTIRGSIHEIAKSCQVEIDQIGVFLYRYNNDVALAVYNGTENIRTLTLSKYLQELGLD